VFALDAPATLLGLIKKQCVGVRYVYVFKRQRECVFVCKREREGVCVCVCVSIWTTKPEILTGAFQVLRQAYCDTKNHSST